MIKWLWQIKEFKKTLRPGACSTSWLSDNCRTTLGLHPILTEWGVCWDSDPVGGFWTNAVIGGAVGSCRGVVGPLIASS